MSSPSISHNLSSHSMSSYSADEASPRLQLKPNKENYNYGNGKTQGTD